MLARTRSSFALIAALAILPGCDEKKATVFAPSEVPVLPATVESSVTVDGEPRSGVQIRIQGGSPATDRTGQTGADGSVAFEGLPAGSYVVSIEGGLPDGVTCDATARTVNVAPGETGTAEFACALPATVIVTVTVDGTPATGEITIGLGQRSRTTTTGTATFENVPPGTHTATTTTPPGSKCANLSREVAVQAGETVEVTIECQGLSGSWTVRYEVIEQTCFAEDPEPFEVSATFVTDGNRLSVRFPDAPAPIAGDVDPETMRFQGTTGQVPLPDILAEERWDVVFRFEAGRLRFEGESLVVFTFPDGSTCRVRYRVTGMRS